jgi:2-keto-4-pentenoate hydratase
VDSVAALVRAVYEGMRRGAFDERDLDRLVGLEGDEVDLGLEVQLGVLEEWLRDEGESLGGWKCGLTSRDMRDSMGPGFRPFGFLLESRIFDSGAQVDRSRIGESSIEPEIYVVMGAPLVGEVSRDEARDAVRLVGAAFEINERRLPPSMRVQALRVAENLTQWGVVAGTGIAEELDMSSLSVTLYRDGESIGSESSCAAIIDDPYLSLARICGNLHRFGRALAPGQRVITGSLLPPAEVPQGASHWEAEFANLGRVEVSLGRS